MSEQLILNRDNNFAQVDEYLKGKGIKKLLLVCGRSAAGLDIGKYFDKLEARLGIEVVKFSDFTPNPDYLSTKAGTELYKKEGCELVAAIGGGSAMDVAKCIKMFASMPDGCEYIEQKITDNGIPFFAVPTTAGTGSEATRYAIIYYNGVKTTVSDYSCIPEAVLFDALALNTLPIYHKKATMLDALCHAVESYWSVHSNEESKGYAATAIKMIFENLDGYLNNTPNGNENMLYAAYIAGKAINITATTAGHAMCYKLTTRYGIAHGHAAALCVERLFHYMYKNTDTCIDKRGAAYLNKMFAELANIMGCSTAAEAADKFTDLLDELALGIPQIKDDGDFEILKSSVNTDRLKNHPIKLDEEIIEELYRQMLQK